MLEKLLSNTKNLTTFLPKNKTIHLAIGSALAITVALHSMVPKPKLETDTLSPEWMAATEEYRTFQRMDDVYD